MVRYNLRCSNGHVFSSWFLDSGTFDFLVGKGQVFCPFCSCTNVSANEKDSNLSSGERISDGFCGDNSVFSISELNVVEDVSVIKNPLSQGMDDEMSRLLSDSGIVDYGFESFYEDEEAINGCNQSGDVIFLNDGGFFINPFSYGKKRHDS